MDQTGWITRLQERQVLWRHDGNPARPHAELTSGRHSDAFFNCSRIIQDPALLAEVCRDIAARADGQQRPERVFGTAYGSIPLALELATAFICRFGFTEREVGGPLTLKRFDVKTDERALVITGSHTKEGSTVIAETVALLETRGALVLPKVGALVSRDGGTVAAGRPVVAADHSVRYWAERHYDGLKHGTASAAIDNPGMLENIARDLARDLKLTPEEQPVWVVATGIDAIALSYTLAKHIGCNAGFAEREMRKDTPLVLRQFPAPSSLKVLAADDVITTGGSTLQTIAALQTSGATVLSYVGAIANRSGKPVLQNRPIFSLLDLSCSDWVPEDCPLCRQGSVAIRPKGRWHELTQPAT
ncbi:MAG: orotate phosphoribosyltransferase [Parcubacteria group bacterium Gr01-1014_31]|nr:MAG: orotate phosphoribosyltransferase [Parcubacteria group bacterium Gr01-1014_31]